MTCSNDGGEPSSTHESMKKLWDEHHARKKEEGKGQKFDAGKLRYDLVDPIAHRAMVEVLTYGAAKYAPENWRKVPDARARYYAAALRHLEAWRAGQNIDQESMMLHLAHAACCIHFLIALFPMPEFSVTVGSLVSEDGRTVWRVVEPEPEPKKKERKNRGKNER